jgi:4'-phosphopantetheinyl transferase
MIGYMDRGVTPTPRPGNPNRRPMRVLIRPFPEGDGPLTVGGGEVHVWEARLDGVGNLRRLLTADECGRADRYKLLRTAEQFVAARGLLRVLLGRYLGCPAEAVPIVVRPDGKPEVGGPVRFNVSHADGLAAFAVGRGEVGVDVEAVRELASRDALVERFFAPAERAQYATLPEALRPAAFVRGWTCKEAVLKGIGCGTRDLDRCVVDLDPRRPPRVLGPRETAAAWALTCWEPEPGYVAAVAYGPS